MVQLAKPIRNVIEKVVAGDKPHSSTTSGHWLRPIVIHTIILTMSQRNWKSYIRYLADRLSSLVGQCSHFPLQFSPTSHSSFCLHSNPARSRMLLGSKLPINSRLHLRLRRLPDHGAHPRKNQTVSITHGSPCGNHLHSHCLPQENRTVHP
jgi:hypothetical protein